VEYTTFKNWAMDRYGDDTFPTTPQCLYRLLAEFAREFGMNDAWIKLQMERNT